MEDIEDAMMSVDQDLNDMWAETLATKQ